MESSNHEIQTFGLKRELKHLIISPHLLEITDTTPLSKLWECSISEKKWKCVESHKIVAGAICPDNIFKERILGITKSDSIGHVLEDVMNETATSRKLGFCIDVGENAVWSVSSVKESSSVENLRDFKADTFWQSDGPQPHKIMINFSEKTKVFFLALYLNHSKDESYTPEALTVSAGTCYQDLSQLAAVTLSKPHGWVLLPLFSSNDKTPLKCNLIQVQIDSNHQLGKDCHIRGIAVLQVSPLPSLTASKTTELDEIVLKPWISESFLSFERLR